MSAEIHRLTGAGPIVAPEPAVVALLEQLLEEAKAGAIKGVGIFLVDGADSVRTGWASGCASETFMIAGAARLQHRVIAKAIE